MARPMSRRSSEQLGVFRSPMMQAGRVVVPVEYWRQPKGLDRLSLLSKISNQYSPDLVNFILDKGVLRSRPGTEEMSPLVDDGAVMNVFSFNAPDSTGAVYRLRTSRMDKWNGTGWDSIGFLSFFGNEHNRFTWTGWGNEILICNGVDKIRSYNVVTGVVEIIDESFPCRHLTSFNGRVIATAVEDSGFKGYRVRWCVKNNNRDWTSQGLTDGIGAGYEDLLATPGGYVDQAMGTYPISDETSLFVREDSLWLMFVTGDVDAPFRFNRIVPSDGSKSRHSIVSTPYGVVLLTRSDVIVAGQNSQESIGLLVVDEILDAITDHDLVSAAYDPFRRVYRISAGGTTVWEYSFIDKGWTRSIYPFAVRDISFIDCSSIGLSFDQLVGSFDGLVGSFDEQVLTVDRHEMWFVGATIVGAAAEDPSLTEDLGTPQPISIATGLLVAGSPLKKTEIIEAQLEYECAMDQSLIFEYSKDKGATWTQYQLLEVTETVGPTISRIRRTLEHHNLQIRVRSAALGKLTLIALNAFIVEGGMVNW